MAQLIARDPSAIGINVTIVPQPSAPFAANGRNSTLLPQPGESFAANNGDGNFDWDLTGRGMRGDVDGYVAEYNPSDAVYDIWFSGFKDTEMWRRGGGGGGTA